MTNIRTIEQALQRGGEVTLAAVPDGMAGKVLADVLAASGGYAAAVRRARRSAAGRGAADAGAFFAPAIEVLEFPAWDCLPYDRVSPHTSIVARRMATLARLIEKATHPQVVLTTVKRDLAARPGPGVRRVGCAVGGRRPRLRHRRSGCLAGAERIPAFADGARARRICGARRHPRSVCRRRRCAGAPRFLGRYAGIDPHFRRRHPAHHRQARPHRPDPGR